jgi:hypothetical protein
MLYQPYLHESSILVSAPTQVVCGRDGQIRQGADGFYDHDVRVVSGLRLTSPHRLDFVGVNAESAGSATYTYAIRGVGETTPDAIVYADVRREVGDGRLVDTVTLRNFGTVEVAVELGLAIELDGQRMDDIKSGRAEAVGGGKPCDASGAYPVGEDITAMVDLDGWASMGDAHHLAAGANVTMGLSITIVRVGLRLFAAVDNPERYVPGVAQMPADVGVAASVQRSIEDLRGMLLSESSCPDRVFVAAGAPWYLTLFGRDAIWTARLCLGLGTDLAVGTLKTLAAHQADHSDERAAASPGRILHEMREKEIDLGGGVTLPPVYYGSIDSTPLWLILLHEAWRSGAAHDVIAELVPYAVPAMRWILTEVEADVDGFLRYVDHSGTGLANQGWKDSADGIRNSDGSRAAPPIALCEVQGYAYAAALGVAELFEEFAPGGVGEDLAPSVLRTWAANLAARFRVSFWVAGGGLKYPAVAIDGHGRQVTALTSNIGHVLGTGIVDSEEAGFIALALTSPEMSSGYGLRTMSARTVGYMPLGYHTGSVWAHDTIIAARGLEAEGFGAEARELATGIIRTAEQFDDRVPELHSGHALADGARPLPYPPACRPQAWSAAAIIAAAAILTTAP